VAVVHICATKPNNEDTPVYNNVTTIAFTSAECTRPWLVPLLGLPYS
jgi:hypothetical protein